MVVPARPVGRVGEHHWRTRRRLGHRGWARSVHRGEHHARVAHRARSDAVQDHQRCVDAGRIAHCDEAILWRVVRATNRRGVQADRHRRRGRARPAALQEAPSGGKDMSDFVNDNTALPAAKIDSSGTATPPSDPTRKWAPYDANVTFDALRSLRTAIVTGAYDNISKYGVVGDGTDAGGSPGVAGVNTNAFQAMLNTAPIGRPIFMPRGVYALSATVTRTRKGLILIG